MRRRTAHSSAEKHPCILLLEGMQTMSGAGNLCALSPLHAAVSSGTPQLIPLVLSSGADINDTDELGQTALHLASETLHKEAIQVLLRCGASINFTTPVTRHAALHLAVCSASSKGGITLAAGGECVELLLQNGANVHTQDWEGQAAIHFACQSGREDLVNLLLRYGADVNSLTKQQESPLFLFLEKKINLRNARLLDKLLSLSYPLRLRNYQGRLPKGLLPPSGQQLKDALLRVSLKVLSLQDICKFNVRKAFEGNRKCWLKGKMPIRLWNSIYIHQEFSYASKIKVSD